MKQKFFPLEDFLNMRSLFVSVPRSFVYVCRLRLVLDRFINRHITTISVSFSHVSLLFGYCNLANTI